MWLLCSRLNITKQYWKGDSTPNFIFFSINNKNDFGELNEINTWFILAVAIPVPDFIQKIGGVKATVS